MITYGTPTPVDELSFRLPVSSDAATPVTLYVYRDGVKIETRSTATGSAELLLSVAAGTSPFFEVTDQDCRPSPAHPGRFDVHWRSVTGAVSYTVEEYVASVWTERATIADNGIGGFVWKSRWLEDATSHQFRVTAIDAGGNAATATTFTALMVRRPDPPTVSIAKTAAALTLDIS